MSIQQHLTYLGATYIGLAALNVLIALALSAVMAGEGLPSGDARELADALTSDMRAVTALLSLLAAAPCLIGGVGLLEREPWSWGLVLVTACLYLLSVPLGTLVGGYALWVLSRPEARQVLGVGADSSSTTRPRVKGYVRVISALSLVLILASFPTCYLGEHAVQGELSKLSPAELKSREFDMVYMRWVLPGILLLFAGVMLAVVAVVSWAFERRVAGQKAGSAGEL